MGRKRGSVQLPAKLKLARIRFEEWLNLGFPLSEALLSKDPDGVVYVGEGGLGVTPRLPKVERWYVKPPGKATSGLHVQVLTFSPKALRVRAILLDGSVCDDFSRKPRNREPQPPKKPASGK